MTTYDARTYLFPDSTLLQRSSADLRGLIAQCLRQAHDQTDGSDIHSDVKIDYAQDVIEQARDILLDRGEAFSDEDRERLGFLDWPLTQEEHAAEDARRALEEQRARLKRVKAEAAETRVNDAIALLRAGQVVVDAEILVGVSLDIGWGSWTHGGGKATISPSGAEVLRMKAGLASACGGEVELAGYSCSRVGVTFESDPAPAWSLRFSPPETPAGWALLISWWHKRAYQHAPHIWYRGDSEFAWHWSLPDWPAEREVGAAQFGYQGYEAFPWVRHHELLADGEWDANFAGYQLTQAQSDEAKRLRLVGERLAYTLTEPLSSAIAGEPEIAGADDSVAEQVFAEQPKGQSFFTRLLGRRV